MIAKLRPLSIVNAMRIERHSVGEAQRGLLARSEIIAPFKINHILDLIVRPAHPSCQDGV